MATVNEELCTSSVQHKSGEIEDSNGCPNLAVFMSQDKLPSLAEIRDFLETNIGIEIDGLNQRGETALMIACQKATVDIVKFLLEKGANPNIRDAKYGYTPLHCASQYWAPDNACSSPDHEDLSQESFRKREVMRDEESLKLMKLLHDEFGATLLPEKGGLNPIELAALDRKMITVEHCISNHWISEVEQIRALEILGMAFALEMMCTNAYEMLSKAKKLRSACGLPPVDYKSDLECCFGRSESKTLNDLCKMKASKYEIEAEGFLVGDRVLPDHYKQNELYQHLFELASNLMEKNKLLPKAFAVSAGCLHLEKRGYSFGCVLLFCEQRIHSVEECDLEQLVSHVGDVLKAYVDVAKGVETSQIQENVEGIVRNLASMLFHITDRCFSVKTMDDFIASITSLLSVIWSRIPKFQVPECKKLMYTSVSVCHTVLRIYVSRLCRNYLFADSNSEQKRFKRLVAQLLCIEGASDIDCYGNTMLHTLMDLLSVKETVMASDLARLLLRHGCPRDVKNKDGKTPVEVAHALGHDYLEEHQMPEFEDLCYLLRGPTEVNPLEELAARSVLCHGIHYEDMLPFKLRDIVQDSILLEGESEFETRPSDVGSDSSYESPW